MEFSDTLYLKVCNMMDCLPFITAVNGFLSGHDFEEIELQFEEDREEYLFEQGEGDYVLTAYYDVGQYGEYGVCEIAPHWEFDIIEFTPLTVPETE